MKVRVMPVRNDVAQQSRMIDGRPDVANLHAAPVRLAGDGTIRFQQIRYNRFIDGRLLGIRAHGDASGSSISISRSSRSSDTPPSSPSISWPKPTGGVSWTDTVAPAHADTSRLRVSHSASTDAT